MLFGNKNSDCDANVDINGTKIQRVNELKFLGVIIDDKLNWKHHISYTQKKNSQECINTVESTKTAESEITSHSLLGPGGTAHTILQRNMGKYLQNEY